MSFSSYMYKIAPATPQPLSPCSPSGSPSSAEPILPISGLDKSSDYIHMSTASQIRGTLSLFFPTSIEKRDVVWLLKVRVDTFEEGKGDSGDVLRWESPDGTVTGSREGEGLFPHLYVPGRSEEGEGSRRLWLRRDEVEDVKEVVCRVGSVGWDLSVQRLVEEGWLI